MTSYAKKERARYWPVSKELLAQYLDGSHTEEDLDGRLIWKQNDLWHRDDDKPAYISRNGSLAWFQNDERYRDGDKPAYIRAAGVLEWFQNGQLHRICGPARIYPDDTLKWFIYDKNITKEVNEWLDGEEWRGTPEQIVEFQLRFV